MRALSRLAITLLLPFGIAHTAEYRIETVAEGLNYPWAMTFLPGGDILITERTGKLRRIHQGKLVQEAINNLPESFSGGQGGLLDIVPDPEYSINQRLYISLVSRKAKHNTLDVIQARLSAHNLEDIKTIFSSSPYKTAYHYGGRLAFLPDQSLLISVGDGFDYREKAQSLDTHFGKLIRINRDGTIPEGNPFIDRPGALPEIWTLGHRNPQGLLVSGNGTVWLHEHGARGGDELNLIEAGKNYGWPAITYGVDYSGAYVSPYTAAKGMQQPIVDWTPSIAPSGFCEYTGDAFPQWRGNLFVATLVEKSVRRLVMERATVKSQEIMFTELGQRIREVRAGPDGFLYLLTDDEDGKLLRVLPN